MGNDSMPCVVLGESWGVAAVVVIMGGSYDFKFSSFRSSRLFLSRTEALWNETRSYTQTIKIRVSTGRLFAISGTDGLETIKAHLAQLNRALS